MSKKTKTPEAVEETPKCKFTAERTIVVSGEVDEDLAGSFMDHLTFLDESEGPITVRILSHGGCSSAGFAVFDAIRLAKNSVVTEVWGCAHSAAALIFQAGDTRMMAPNAELLVHFGRISCGGEDGQTSKELRKLVADIERTDRTYVATIAATSGNHLSVVSKWCDDEMTFTAQAAVACGLADGILGEKT